MKKTKNTKSNRKAEYTKFINSTREKRMAMFQEMSMIARIDLVTDKCALPAAFKQTLRANLHNHPEMFPPDSFLDIINWLYESQVACSFGLIDIKYL